MPMSDRQSLQEGDVAEVSFVMENPLNNGRHSHQLRVIDQLGETVYFDMPYDHIPGTLILAPDDHLYVRDESGSDSLFGTIARIEEVVPNAPA